MLLHRGELQLPLDRCSAAQGMNWLVRMFGGAFVRKLGYLAAAAVVALLGVLFRG